ncbi:hypothetical protein HDU96_005352, partial [Phlyctochytrium bullatum]
ASHVTAKLLSAHPEYFVVVLDKLDYCSSLKNLASAADNPNYKFIKGDVTSPDFVNFVMKEYKIDTVFHFAAQSHVDNSFGNSFEFTKNNVLGTHVLLEAARLYEIKRFIHVSTDEVYGESELAMPLCNEDANLSPSNPYSATKAAAECLVLAYLKSFKLPVIITRSNNVYGPQQYPEKVIPKFICSLLNGRKCYIHGNGRNSRHYLYVSDAADAFITVMHKGVPGETYNIGSPFEIANLHLARYLLMEFGLAPEKVVNGTEVYAETMPPRTKHDEQLHIKGRYLDAPLEGEERYLEFVDDRPFNDRRYAIGSVKMENLGWIPKVPFSQGIEETVVSQEFTVGKVDAGMAILLSPDHHLIEFPATILPDGVTTGSIINLTIERNLDEERRQREEFGDLQRTIYETFSKTPEAPVLSLRSVTQTSATIQWKPLELHAADLRGIDVYRNNQKLTIPIQPTATSAKLSGLEVNHEYEVWIVVRTSAGAFTSNKINLKTHSLDNLTGINVCFGALGNESDADAMIELLGRIGASYTEELTTDNTHLICTFARGPKYEKALEWNIPAVSPEFLKACEQNGKVMPSHSYYVQGV